MARLHLFDIIPNSDSAETASNSEPSLGVNPLNAAQMIGGAFGAGAFYFKSTDGGVTWSDYGSLPSGDKTIAWKQDGSAGLTASITSVQSINPFRDTVQTFSGTIAGSSFGPSINTTPPGRGIDQPWMRTGPSNHVYMAGNDLANVGGMTAVVLVSTNGGSTYNEVTVDRVGGGAGQDAPSVRLAVSGNTVYSAFTRWNSTRDTDAFGETRYNSQVVIVRSDNGGADNFSALGTGGNGVTVATPTSWFANTSNAPLTLGQQRTSADLAIAVDPNNAQHVFVAYGDAPGTVGSGNLRLHVTESTNGGATWTEKFLTSQLTRSALPGLAILPNGTIGLLYGNYNPATNQLSEHLLTTSNNDFVPTKDITLAPQSNAALFTASTLPIGDFFDLTSVGNTFYGTFSAPNADDGTNAQFSSGVFQRKYAGTPGTSSFQTTNLNGNIVSFSIDPFFFSYRFDTIDATFESPPTLKLPAFGPGAGGWSSQDAYPRLLGDVIGNGMADIVGFAQNGVYVSLANGTGGFQDPPTPVPNTFWGAQTGGWSSQDKYPRFMADVNANGRADIVGFAQDRVYVSLANGTGGFQTQQPATPPDFWSVQTGGWSSQDKYPRFMADVNGDGRADIVGFAQDRVYVSLADGTGGFLTQQPATPPDFWSVQTGGWSSQDAYPRELADVNGDGRADIVGFSSVGVFVSRAIGGGQFAGQEFELNAFGPGGGWTSQNTFPRLLDDVNGDGMADIVGFSDSGVYVAFATGGGDFAAPVFKLGAFGPSAGGWTSNDLFPREVADVTGDGMADIVGFATNGVTTAPALAGTTLVMAADGLTSNTMTGSSAGDELQLDPSSSFPGTVAGMSGPDTLAMSPASSPGGTLSATDGASSANIALLGNYLASTFVSSGDGSGGTSIAASQAADVSQNTLLAQPQHA